MARATEKADEMVMEALPKKVRTALEAEGLKPSDIVDQFKEACASGGGDLRNGAPYGWRFKDEHNQELVVVEAEQVVIGRIMIWHREGRSPGAICKNLRLNKMLPRGKDWHRQTVKRIIERANRVTKEG